MSPRAAAGAIRAQASRVATSADRTPIAYDVIGDGPPLVFVTGALCHRRFQPVRHGARILSRAFRVITYDRRGRGDSGASGVWSLDREIDDLEAVVDAVGGRAQLYGHSSGAVISLHAAHRLPAKIEHVVLYDASWVADEDEAAQFAVVRSRVDDLLERDRGAAIKQFLVGIGMPKAFARLLPFLPGWRTQLALAPTLRYDMALTAVTPPLDMAAQIAVPVHVIAGERSPEGLHRVARDIASAIPGATSELLAGQDHLVSEKVLLSVLEAHLRHNGGMPASDPARALSREARTGRGSGPPAEWRR